MSLPWPFASAEARLTRLLERAKAGDRDAFREAYHGLHAKVHAYVARRARPEEVEDLVARTFHKLLERLQSFDPAKGEPLAFVLSIARNLLLDDARKARPTVDVDEVDPTAAGLLHHQTPLSQLLTDERLRSLRARLLALPARTQEMISLRYGDGLTHGEIAALLGLQEDAVKQRISRAVRELRAAEDAEPEGKGALA